MIQRGDDRRVVSVSAAAIYSGAAFVGIVESLIPGGEEFTVLPATGALLLSALTILVGSRVPRIALAALGPLGAALIGVAVASTTGYADSAVLYMWPAVWMAFFFGIWGTAFIVGWIGPVHGAVLLSLPSAESNIDRWIDVVVAVFVVAAVVRSLAARNERLVAKLEGEARVDPLTGLLNRRGLEERMKAELSRASRDGAPLAAVVLDLDHFKRINDEHGHEIGDRVLVWLGALLREQARGVDVAARVGGEEFVVLLPRADHDAGHIFAERVRRAVAGDRAGERARARRRGGHAAADRECGRGVSRRAGRRLGAARGGRPGALRGQAGRPQPHRGRPSRESREGHARDRLGADGAQREPGGALAAGRRRVSGGAQQLDQVGGRLERIGDHGAGVERHGGGDVATGRGDEDLAGQRASRVEGGEATQVVGVDGAGGADEDGGHGGAPMGAAGGDGDTVPRDSHKLK